MEEVQNYAYAQQGYANQRMVGFGEALSRGFKNYANFDGRASRSEYWWWALSLIVCVIPILGWIYAFAIIIPSIALVVRRLHDTGRSGWWWFIGIIPFVGSLCLLIFELLPSQEGDNKYGPMPNLK
ncbi:MAG: DUF805 domain-containing protein [Clostridium sp.]|nr:DUF805 domain-containing protein [Clostridium sp.]